MSGLFAPGLWLTFVETMSEQEIKDYLDTFPGVTVQSYYEPLKLVSINVPEDTESTLQYSFDQSKVKRVERRTYLRPS